jgi:hypothetical protein
MFSVCLLLILYSPAVLPDASAKHIDPDHTRKERAKDKLRKAEAEGSHLWAVTKEKLFQPAVAGGLFSIRACTLHFDSMF